MYSSPHFACGIHMFNSTTNVLTANETRFFLRFFFSPQHCRGKKKTLLFVTLSLCIERASLSLSLPLPRVCVCVCVQKRSTVMLYLIGCGPPGVLTFPVADFKLPQVNYTCDVYSRRGHGWNMSFALLNCYHVAGIVFFFCHLMCWIVKLFRTFLIKSWKRICLNFWMLFMESQSPSPQRTHGNTRTHCVLKGHLLTQSTQ